jgi:hypothetical protein
MLRVGSILQQPPVPANKASQTTCGCFGRHTKSMKTKGFVPGVTSRREVHLTIMALRRIWHNAASPGQADFNRRCTATGTTARPGTEDAGISRGDEA